MGEGRWMEKGPTFTRTAIAMKVNGKKIVWTDEDSSSSAMVTPMTVCILWTSWMVRARSHGVSASLLVTDTKVAGKNQCVTAAECILLLVVTSGRVSIVMTNV